MDHFQSRMLAILRKGTFRQILLSIAVFAFLIWAGTHLYRVWQVSKRFPYVRPFLVTGTGAPESGAFEIKDGETIIVLRNPGTALHLSIKCSRGWKSRGAKVQVKFATEARQLGTESFEGMWWNKSLTFDEAMLGDASFLKLSFSFDKETGPLTVRECVFRTTNQYPKFVILGLDGACLSMIDPLMQSNRLPNFKRLTEIGAYGDLKSEDPTFSPVIWTTLSTGRTPEDHGITFFVAQNTPETSSTIRTKRFWNIFSQYSNMTSLIVGWYLTWPIEEVHGGIISDRAYYKYKHGKLFYPDDIFESDFYRIFGEINEHLEEHLLKFTPFPYHRDFAKRFPPDSVERSVSSIMSKRLASVYRRDTSYGEAGLFFEKSLGPNVLAVYMRGADFTQHGFWKYMQPDSVPFFPVSDQEKEWLGNVIPNYYAHLDHIVGEYLDSIDDETTLFIISDHGAQGISEEEAGDPELSGDHSINGIIFMKGPGVRKGYRIPKASIYDFLPTFLQMAGLPPGKDMPGKVLTDALTPEFLSANPEKRIPTYGLRDTVAKEESSQDVDEEIREELRALGYIQ